MEVLQNPYVHKQQTHLWWFYKGFRSPGTSTTCVHKGFVDFLKPSPALRLAFRDFAICVYKPVKPIRNRWKQSIDFHYILYCFHRFYLAFHTIIDCVQFIFTYFWNILAPGGYLVPPYCSWSFMAERASRTADKPTHMAWVLFTRWWAKKGAADL